MDIRLIDMNILRKQIAVARRGPFLHRHLPTTCGGDEEAAMEDIQRAAEIAYAADSLLKQNTV